MAWALILHNDRLDQLEGEDPRYADCPQFCSRPEADRARGCPDCLVTHMYRELEEEVSEELQELSLRRKLPASHRWPWSLRTMRAQVAAVSSLDAAFRESVNPRWTVRDRILVGQYRNLNSLFRRQQLKKPPKEDRDA